MDKKKRKNLIIAGVAGVILLAAIVAVLLLHVFRLITGEIKSDTRSDQYLEQMIGAASAGDRNAMDALYLSQGVSKKSMEKDMQTLLEVWDGEQEFTYKKTGYNRKTTTSNGKRIKTITANYKITTASGEKMSVVLRHVEGDNGDSGLTNFVIRTEESLKPIGTLGSMGKWNVVQWFLFVFSMAVFGAAVVSTADCYRNKIRYRWGWIALIMLVYVAPGFSLMLEDRRKVLRFTCSVALMGLSKYVVYPENGVMFSLCLPAGMGIYWVMRKHLLEERSNQGNIHL
ncbi:hypothetical protein LI031_08650 [Enterocloster citroniae]|uniref:hypothetical protein n=1 Tax=Enterocloster citroniae TaxID=358743 RepID=UPI001D068205|nr:hypothetical protein [Enterocloster citroniae]MCB7063906.1 hypothetical protein [Enterocloster citroniae]